MWDTVANVVMALFGVAGVIGGWVFRRELSRNETDHRALWDRMEQIDSLMVSKEEFRMLQVGADMRFKELDRDIKNTGESLQRVIREELGGVTKRLDNIMLALNTRRQGE